MLCEFFHKFKKTAVRNPDSTSEMQRGRLLEPKSLKRLHQVKEFKSSQDIKKNGLNYFTTLSENKLDQRVYSTIHFYTGMDYERINSHERKRVIPNPMLESSLWKYYEEKNDIMSNELQKHIVKKDIFVFKGIDEDRFEMMKKEGDEKSFFGLKGTVIRDRGFVSTTLLSECIMKKEFILKIKVPAGTHGAYIADISTVRGEKELLLDRDQSMVIKNIKIKNGLTTIECDLLEKIKPKATPTTH